MALPADFWRYEHKLNIFRTKPCLRLLRDGICEWKSHCQYSHCVSWPRRPPQKYQYRPEICPHLVTDSSGEVDVRSVCFAGKKCQFAHSKEEVLYHPDVFKTTICEDHRSGSTSRGSRPGHRNRCHRYYCPFAHGSAELRQSSLTEEERDRCIKAVSRLPSSDCCEFCMPHQLSNLSQLNGGARALLDAPRAAKEDSESSSPQAQLSTAPAPLWTPATEPQAVAAPYDQADLGVPKALPAPPLGAAPSMAAGAGVVVPIRPGQWIAAPPQVGGELQPYPFANSGGLGSEGPCGVAMPMQATQNSALPMVHFSNMVAGMPPASGGCFYGATMPNNQIQAFAVLQQAGLERHWETLRARGFVEHLDSMTPADMNAMGMSPVEQQQLREVLNDMLYRNQHYALQRGTAAYQMMPVAAARPPEPPTQMPALLYNGGGYAAQWVASAAGSPVPGHSAGPAGAAGFAGAAMPPQGYAAPPGAVPWSQAPVMGQPFVSPVQPATPYQSAPLLQPPLGQLVSPPEAQAQALANMNQLPKVPPLPFGAHDNVQQPPPQQHQPPQLPLAAQPLAQQLQQLQPQQQQMLQPPPLPLPAPPQPPVQQKQHQQPPPLPLPAPEQQHGVESKGQQASQQEATGDLAGPQSVGQS